MTHLFALDLLLFVLINLAPGLGILLFVGNFPRNGVIAIATIWCLSSAWNLLWSLVTLYFGMFSAFAVLAIAAVPVLFGFLKQRKIIPRLKSPSTSRFLGGYELLPLVVMAIFASVLLFTPKWNFLISPNADAGNYETYSNHFWTSGELYWGVDDYIDRGVPTEWIQSKNTWIVDEHEKLAKPTYVYGYPVLLSIAKSVFGRAEVSWIVNAFFSILSMGLLAVLGTRLSRSSSVGAGLALVSGITPLYYYYSKQIMAESTALFGFLVFLVCCIGYQSERRSSYIAGMLAGTFLVLQVKLDAFIIPALLLIGLVGAALSSSESRRQLLRIRFSFPLIGGCILFSAITIILLENTYYLHKIAFKNSELLSVPGYPFLLTYSIFLFVGFTIFPVALRVLERALPSTSKIQLGFSIALPGILAIAWIIFVAWNLALRPVGQDLVNNHDAFNLLRLFMVSSPTLLLAFWVLFPLSLAKSEGISRSLLIAGALGLLLLLEESRHSPLELFWMRRYLVLLVPTVVISLSLLLRVEKDRTADRGRVLSLVSLLVGSLVFQAIQLEPLLRHRVNGDAVQALETLQKYVPEKALLVSIGSGHVIRGTVNNFRSLRSGPTLLNVPAEGLLEVSRMFPEYRDDFYVISPAKIDQQDLQFSSTDQQVSDVDPFLISKGLFSFQISTTMEQVRNNPDAKNERPYFLYRFR